MDVLLLVFLYWTAVLVGIIVVIMFLCKETDSNGLGTSRPGYRSLALGSSLVDMAGLVFIGLPSIGTWCLHDLVATEVYCVPIMISANPLHVFLFSVIVSTVWLRQSFLLDRQEDGSKNRLAADAGGCWGRRLLVSGPPLWLVLFVCVTCFVLLWLDRITSRESGFIEADLCLLQPVVTTGYVVVGAVTLHVVWWLVAVMTRDTIDNKQQSGGLTVAGQRQGRTELEPTRHEGKHGRTVKTLTLFLAMTSVWLPAIQCIFLCFVLNISYITVSFILLLTLMFACTVTSVSLCLSVGVYIHARKQSEKPTRFQNFIPSTFGEHVTEMTYLRLEKSTRTRM